MNCRDFTAEFEERRHALTEAAKSHLTDCPDCEKTSGEQTRLWQMIDQLKRVDAPPTFDFRVKARIADSKPTDFQPRFLPVLRYVLPIGVVVMLLGLIAFNTNYFSGGDVSTQTAATASQPPIESIVEPINSFSSNQTNAANAIDTTASANIANSPGETMDANRTPQIAAANRSPKSRVENSQKNVKEDEGAGSHDLLSSNSDVEYPRGINPNQKIEPSPTSNNAQPASDETILDFFGIKIVSENGRRKVQTVSGSAERAGVKAGDVIVAIDGELLSAEPLRTKTFGFKKITVLRGTERIEITLQR